MSIRTKPPTFWKFLAGATFVLVLLILVWMMFDVHILRPNAKEGHEALDVAIWTLPPTFAVTLIFGVAWQKAINQVRSTAQKRLEESDGLIGEAARSDFLLEVIGLGVSFDGYRQDSLLDALQAGNHSRNIREADPLEFGWSAVGKKESARTGASDALKNACADIPIHWGVPVFYAASSVNDPGSPEDTRPEIGRTPGVLDEHLFLLGPVFRCERPDRILQEVFAFFEANPDLPFVVLRSDDGLAARDRARPAGAAALIRDGYYIPDMPDASIGMVLARRERVNAVRPFGFDDIDRNSASAATLDREGIGRRLYLAYAKLAEGLMSDSGAAPESSWSPKVPEWLPLAEKFRIQENIFGERTVDSMHRDAEFASTATEWVPTPWFPVPWSNDQLSCFDRMPSLGFIHRPVYVNMTDQNGRLFPRREQRNAALHSGWNEALQTLGELQRKIGPQRVISAGNDDVESLVAMEALLRAHMETGGPEIDTSKPDQFVNTDRRLGNTGAATLFMQIAVGVMANCRTGGTSVAINMRDPNEATVIVISPPSEAAQSL